MAIYVGIDGIPKGWVAVYLNDDGNHRFARAERAVELLSGPYERAMIDMPIGLAERGYRSCDIEARSLVAPRSFWARAMALKRAVTNELKYSKTTGLR